LPRVPAACAGPAPDLGDAFWVAGAPAGNGSWNTAGGELVSIAG
jgi:hypothetical protein